MSIAFPRWRSFCQRIFLMFVLVSTSSFSAKAGGVRITNHGHSSLLIRGGGHSVLLNPFRSVGCATGLKEPRLRANVILASSELADEGARIAKGTFLVKPGSYRIGGLSLEGFIAPHDRFGGRRYGFSTLWQWTQGGLNFAHLGGGAAPLTGENKVLLGRPDVLFIAVGGGSKVYNGLEAAQVVKELKPKRVIPVQYLRRSQAIADCDQTTVQPFLDAMKGTEIRKVGKTLYLSNTLSDQTVINLMR